MKASHSAGASSNETDSASPPVCSATRFRYRIELEDGLVEIAESLAEKHHTGAKFIATTYIPEGYISYDHLGGSDIVHDDSFSNHAEPPRYDGMDIGLDEIDVFFVYPWPGEQEMMLKLFQSVASEDAILIAYYGDEEMYLPKTVVSKQKSVFINLTITVFHTS